MDDLEPEDIAENAVRWIDTSCMVVDCLTKKMKPSNIIATHLFKQIVVGTDGRVSNAEVKEAKVETRKEIP